MQAILASGMLWLAALGGTSQANVIVLTGSAMTPFAAIAASAIRWLPDSNVCAMTLPYALQNLPDSGFAEGFPDTECARWMQFPQELAASTTQVERVTLLRAGTGTYHAYQTPTTLHTGYGCLYEEESWKVSRSSKQGLEEPAHFYLKLTFRF
jgi:hypothetical protein